MTGAEEVFAGRDRLQQTFDVSRETMARLDSYHALLVKWNKAINLVSKGTIDQAWTRHFLDSAQLLVLAPDRIDSWVDLGSGGGFPGLVVAAFLAERSPDTEVVLVESDTRKATFLTQAARAMGLPIRVIADRIEVVPPLGASVVSARALAPLPKLFPLVARHLAPGGVGLLQKGAHVDDELAAALVHWRASVQKSPSQSGSESVIVRVRDLCRI